MAYGEPATALARGQTLVNGLMSAREENVTDVKGDETAGATKMKVLRNIPRLSGKCFNLIVRECTVPFWEACISAVETPGENYRVCAICSSGIGKTTSTFVLLRLLLLQGKCVVYHVCSRERIGWIFEFRPKAPSDPTSSSPYICSVYDEMDFWKIPSLRTRETYYVVDPSASSRDCAPNDDLPARVIIVTCPNAVHWGGRSFTKYRRDITLVSGGVFLYYPIWSWAELKQARELLNLDARVSLTLEEMRVRYASVGGVPRHLWMPEWNFPIFAKTLVRAIHSLSPHESESVAMGRWEVLDTNNSEHAKSETIGYDVMLNDFDAPLVRPISSMIRKEAFEYHWRYVRTSAYSHSHRGPAFEDYSWLHMIGDTKRFMRTRPCVSRLNRSVYNRIQELPLGGCIDMQRAQDIISAARREPWMLFLPNSDQEEFVEFVYAEVPLVLSSFAGSHLPVHFHAFLSSTTPAHSSKRGGIWNLEQRLREGENATVYFLVPPSQFRGFSTKPARPMSSKITFRHVEIPMPPL
jgi:hypothetical protein